MKKIALFTQHLKCGGIERSLINLSQELIKNNYDVYIYVIFKTGEFIEFIPKEIEVLTIPLSKSFVKTLPMHSTKITLKELLKKRDYYHSALLGINYFRYRSGFPDTNNNFKKIKSLKTKFDIAISYHIHSPFLVKYVAEKVEASQKISWIHFDFKTTQYKVDKLKKYLDCYDNFYGVSQQVVDEFIQLCPQYTNWTKVVYNIINKDEMVEKSLEELPDLDRLSKNKISILSVGRLEHEKGFDLAIKVCSKLVKKGLDFHWYIAGAGSEQKSLELLIQKENLEEYMTLLGLQMNPYPFFRLCDIYVQTSRHEGWGLTITEAKAFGKPIVTTNFPAAKEQIIDGKTGFITEFDVLAMSNKIELLIQEPKLRELFRVNLNKEYSQSELTLEDIF